VDSKLTIGIQYLYNEQPRLKKRAGDAGYDLMAVSAEKLIFDQGHVYEYGTGIQLAIPQGYVGLVYPRSSVSKTNCSLANSVGVIDSSYRGEIKVRFYGPAAPFAIGDRCAQLILMPIPAVSFVEVSELDDTERGAGGFGSTGR
jgi:dUTP pyrophosphatase